MVQMDVARGRAEVAADIDAPVRAVAEAGEEADEGLLHQVVGGLALAARQPPAEAPQGRLVTRVHRLQLGDGCRPIDFEVRWCKLHGGAFPPASGLPRPLAG